MMSKWNPKIAVEKLENLNIEVGTRPLLNRSPTLITGKEMPTQFGKNRFVLETANTNRFTSLAIDLDNESHCVIRRHRLKITLKQTF